MSLQLVACNLPQDYETARQELHMELIDILSPNLSLKEKLNFF